MKAFKIQVATDIATWKDVFSTTKAGARSVTDETFTFTTARHVRMYGTDRGNTSKGYSIFDFMVMNDSVPKTLASDARNTSDFLKPLMKCKNRALKYNVPSASFVKISIIDFCGRQVAELINVFK
jgi:hypothetical protein